MVRLIVSTPIRETEVSERVVEAAVQFVSDPEVDLEGDRVTVTGRDLTLLRQRVWDAAIIDTFRGQVLHGIRPYPGGMQTTFRLSKQAAYLDRLSFPVSTHALGDLSVQIVVEPDDPWHEAEDMAWWLCPETRDGVIVDDAP